MLRELGADLAIDYTTQDFAEVVLSETSGHGVDAVFDTVGGGLVSSSIPVLRPFGRAATILPPTGDLSGLYLRNQTLHGVFLTRERARLLALAELVDSGLLRPIVAQVEPLDGIFEVHRRLETGHGRGKVVLSIFGP